jgi:hypothetical protein
MRLVVSLTTIPSRILKIQNTIDSILNQSIKPDRIYLAIPENCRRQKKQPYIIPPKILENSAVEILRETWDSGPSMKLLPALKKEQEPDTLIVTVDDDHFYQNQFLEVLIKYTEKHPDSALGFNGWNIDPLLNENRYEFIDKNFTIPVKSDVLEGYRGVLYKKKFFSENVFDYKGFPKIAHKVDDVWISAHLARNGVERLVLPGVYCVEEELPKGLHKRWSFKSVNRRMAREFRKRGFW